MKLNLRQIGSAIGAVAFIIACSSVVPEAPTAPTPPPEATPPSIEEAPTPVPVCSLSRPNGLRADLDRDNSRVDVWWEPVPDASEYEATLTVEGAPVSGIGGADGLLHLSTASWSWRPEGREGNFTFTVWAIGCPDGDGPETGVGRGPAASVGFTFTSK